jgi:hypothetical protein
VLAPNTCANDRDGGAPGAEWPLLMSTIPALRRDRANGLLPGTPYPGLGIIL